MESSFLDDPRLLLPLCRWKGEDEYGEVGSGREAEQRENGTGRGRREPAKKWLQTS